MAKSNELNCVSLNFMFITRANSESSQMLKHLASSKKGILQDIWHPIYFITI